MTTQTQQTEVVAHKGLHYFNPPTDSDIYIPGGITESSLIFFELTLREKANRFQIEFSMCDAKTDEDRSLHFRYAVCIQEQTAIFYNRSPKDVKGQFATRFDPDVFKPGQAFDVSARFHANSFEFQVNDLDPHPFQYAFQKFNCVKISGDVFIRDVHCHFTSFPSTPYHFSIPKGLEVGDYLTFRGMCPVDAKNFKISFLKSGKDVGKMELSKDDLLVQLTVDFRGTGKEEKGAKTGDVQLSHWLDGKLAQNPTEKRAPEATIVPGREFRLDLWMDKDQIVYGLDRREHLGRLRHSGLYGIGAIRMDGGISLTSFEMDRANNRILTKEKKSFDLKNYGLIKSFLKMPANVTVRELVTSVAISASVNATATTFEIELQGSSGDVVYLFAAFMEEGKTYVMKHNDKKGDWGPPEEFTEHFPFTKGARFQMEICGAGKKGIQVAIDGIPTLAFQNRLDIFTVTSIQVRGDVSVYRIVAL